MAVFDVDEDGLTDLESDLEEFGDENDDKFGKGRDSVFLFLFINLHEAASDVDKSGLL